MLSASALERAVDLQRRSYALLRWLSDGLGRGFVSIDAAHAYATLPEGALAWIETHYDEVPSEARPPREDVVALANLFATYLEGSFDLFEEPGQRLASSSFGGRCYCPLCTYLVDLPHLRPKKVTSIDKLRADRLERATLVALAAEVGAPGGDATIDAVLRDPSLREARARLAYARDLFQRLEGISEGPTTLALWRRFAWTEKGSPLRGFTLRADDILQAERLLVERLAG